jgi:hypothetical protein
MDVSQSPDLHEARLLHLHRELPRPQQMARSQVQVTLQNLRAVVPASRVAKVQDPPSEGPLWLSTVKLAGHVGRDCLLLGHLPPCRIGPPLPPRNRSGRG